MGRAKVQKHFYLKLIGQLFICADVDAGLFVDLLPVQRVGSGLFDKINVTEMKR